MAQTRPIEQDHPEEPDDPRSGVLVPVEPAAVAPAGSSDDALPDPEETARALGLCVAEILSGTRDVDSIARWITEEVQRHLQHRAAMAGRARSLARRPAGRPVMRVGSVLVCRPCTDVAEATVVVHTRNRARAVAIRLEVHRGRWRATAVGVL